MQTISTEIARLMALRSQRVKVAVEVAHTTPLRYCTGDDPVEVSGEMYYPRAMSLEPVVQDDPDQSRCALVIDDRDLELRAWMYLQGGFSEKTVTISELQWDDSIHTWRVTRSWEIQAENSQWTRTDHRINLNGAVGFRPRAGSAVGSVRCPYNFRGVFCGYAGADLTCSRTLDDCTAKGNQTRFGGFYRAPKAGDTIRITTTSTIVYFQGWLEQPPPPGGADDVPITRQPSGGRLAPDPPTAPASPGGGQQTPSGGSVAS